MRIAFIGSEAFARIPLALIDAGHEVTHLLGFASPTATPISRATVEAASGMRWDAHRVTRERLESIHRSNAELILCAGYPERLDIRPGDPVPAVNVHPSPLPEGRGPAPIPWAILSGRESTAVTFHEMVERFDAGPVLLQLPLAISPRETAPSLDSRCRKLAAEMAVQLAADFDRFWAARTAQGPATFCRLPRRLDRTLNLNGGVEAIDRVLRAFTPGNIFVHLHGRTWVVFDAVCWPEPHSFRPGGVVAVAGGDRLLAAADGFVLMRSALPERVARLRLAMGNLKRFVR